MYTSKTRTATRFTVLGLLAASALLAQNNGPDPSGWRRFGDRPGDYAADTEEQAAPPPAEGVPADQAPPPVPRAQQPYGASQRQPYGPPPLQQRGQYPAPGQQDRYAQQERYTPPPAQLTIRPGTYLTVRINQMLSSDRNQPGDAFAASLVKPLVVDGVVVAERGETVGGRVAEAQKAGRVSGNSRLGIELTELTLADGSQVPIRCQLIGRSGETSYGRDATAIGATTLGGAAIGAAVNGGVGAGVGAAAGLVVSTVGVMLTRGRATVLGPETVLTFRVDAPVTVATDRAPEAFRYVSPDDYQQAADSQVLRQRPMQNGCGPYGCAPGPTYYTGGYYGGYWGSPYYYPYWGPSFSFFYGGPRYYGHGYYYGGRYGGRGGFSHGRR